MQDPNEAYQLDVEGIEGLDPVRTTVDLWDLGSGDYLEGQEFDQPTVAAPETGAIDLVADDNSRNQRLLIIVAMALLLAAGGYFFLLQEDDSYLADVGAINEGPGPDSMGYAEEPGMFDQVLIFLGVKDPPMPTLPPGYAGGPDPSINPDPNVIKMPTDPKSNATPGVDGKNGKMDVEVTEITSNSLLPEMIVEIVEGNPYWILPNQMRSRDPGLKRSWGADEEDALRRRMNSPFTYQRYKAVQEIRMKKLKGSEVLLFEALKEKKFWTRMAALIGIAEFGYPVDLATVDKALNGARDDLVANYFKRFRLKPSGAEGFIMRHAVKLVGERARLHILQSLSRNPNEINRLYLIASTYDPGSRVGRWINRAISRIKTNAQEMGLFDRIVRGYEKAPSSLLKDDIIAAQITNYELNRPKEIQLFGVEQEQTATSSPDDGFEELEVIEIKADQF